MPASSSLQETLQPILLRWLEAGLAPEAALEGMTPAFASRLGQIPADFTFDAFFHTEPQARWAWATIEFREIFDGPFYFYWPMTWGILTQEAARAVVGESGAPQQNIFLAQKHHWRPRIQKQLERQQLLAIAYYPLLQPHYHSWLIVLRADEPNTFEFSTAFSSGEWLIVIESQATTVDAITQQLIALCNANPWYGWIQAAKAQQAQSG